MKMKQMFTKNLCIYMFIGMVVTVFAIFGFQTIVSQSTNTKSSNDKLDAVEEKLKSNDDEIEQLTQSLGENNLAKTRAFARMIKLDPSIIKKKSTLDDICEKLMANELHVIDENGIITNSTIESYVGFDMGSGEQSAVFLELLKDPSKEIVQEPEVNSIEGNVIQYIGVAREDKKGFVQVGVHPEVLENMLANTAIDVVLKNDSYGTNGSIFAIDKETNKILAIKNESLIGEDASKAGFPDKLETGEGVLTIDGSKQHYVTREYNGMMIGTLLPDNEYYSERISQTLMVSLSILIIFIVLLIMINRLVDRKISRGIGRIIEELQVITAGDLDRIVDEKGNKEFEQLSGSINKMVDSIKSNLSKNEELLAKQKEDMEKNLQLIENIKKICANLDEVSQETLVTSQEIHNGTGEQEKAVESLKEIMSLLSNQLGKSETSSMEIADTTKTAVQKLMDTKNRMELLEQSIGEISNTSVEIEKIIGEINSIAEQTNLLSLNASIEAARAGEMGKGFAVVAGQVGELASRSAEAAKETGDLIMNSIHAVNNGKEITHMAMEEFLQVVTEIEHASEGVVEIADMVREHVEIVTEAMDGFEKISDVVEQNVEISKRSEHVSSNMAKEAKELHEMVD